MGASGRPELRGNKFGVGIRGRSDEPTVFDRGVKDRSKRVATGKDRYTSDDVNDGEGVGGGSSVLIGVVLVVAEVD